MKISLMATEWAPWPGKPSEYILPLEDLFKKIKNLGADYVELVYLWNFKKEDVPRIRKLMKKYDIHIACVNSVCALNSPNNPSEVKKQQHQLIDSIKTSGKLDSQFVVVYFGKNKLRGEKKAIEDCKKNFDSCFRLAADEGITLVLENEFDIEGIEQTRTAEGVKKLLEGVGSPSLKLNFDIGNFHIAGEEAFPYAYVTLKEYIAYIHAKDAVKYDGQIYGEEVKRKLMRDLSGDYICTTIGNGAINWDGFIRSLTDARYKGFLTIEPHSLEDRLDETIKKSIEYMLQRIKF